MTELQKVMVDQLKQAVFNYQRDADLTEEEAGDDAAGMGELFEEIVARFLPTLTSQSPPPTDDVRGRARGIVADVFEEKAAALERAPLPNRVAVALVRKQADEFRAGQNDSSEQMAIALAALSAHLPPPIRGEKFEGLLSEFKDAVGSHARATLQGDHSYGPRIAAIETKLRAALATPSSPEGWVLVPREPWQAMLNAAADYLTEKGGRDAHMRLPSGFFWHEVWTRMLAASPSSKENKS